MWTKIDKKIETSNANIVILIESLIVIDLHSMTVDLISTSKVLVYFIKN